MDGNIVVAAKWLGASMIVASGILVGGGYWVASREVSRLSEAMRVRPEVQAPFPGVGAISPTTLPPADADSANDMQRLRELLRPNEDLRFPPLDSGRPTTDPSRATGPVAN